MSNFTLKYLLPLLLITVLCFVGVKAFYRQVEQRMAGVETEPKQSSDPPVAALNPAAATDGQANVDASVITRRNLFASKEDEAAEEEAIDSLAGVEPTKLAFVLMGTAIDADNDNRAFIYDKKKRKQEMYREGDDLQGALISQISYGKVIITVNGKNELLDISEARKIIFEQQCEKLIDREKVVEMAIRRTENSGIVFIDATKPDVGRVTFNDIQDQHLLVFGMAELVCT